ncbi:MAG: hypothetical protein WBL68_17085 [Nitrososphaeraceae archaeon]
MMILYGAIHLQKVDACPNMFPAMVPVNKCKPNPTYCATAGSLKPTEIPITAKNVPGGVPETRSTTTICPENGPYSYKFWSVQYGIIDSLIYLPARFQAFLVNRTAAFGVYK